MFYYKSKIFRFKECPWLEIHCFFVFWIVESHGQRVTGCLPPLLAYVPRPNSSCPMSTAIAVAVKFKDSCPPISHIMLAPNLENYESIVHENYENYAKHLKVLLSQKLRIWFSINWNVPITKQTNKHQNPIRFTKK